MDLVKALRAMHHCPQWQESIEAACLFAGKEYGPPVLQAMTKQFLDELNYDPKTLVVTVPVSEIGEALLEAVESWSPPVPVEVAEVIEEPGVVEHLLDRVDALEARLSVTEP